MSTEDELYEANQALGRVRDLCDSWDRMTKGPSSVTIQIRDAIADTLTPDAVPQ